MQNLIKFFVVAVAVLASGCMSVGGVMGYRTLQADIAKGNQANAEYIRSIVSADMDLKTALNKIYSV